VKTRRDRTELIALLRQGGFTPGKRDLDAVIGHLADDDSKVSREAERAIAGLGEVALEKLGAHANDPDPRVRAGVYRTLGRMAVPGETAASWLVQGLEDVDPRARRHAATALGKLRGSSAAALVEDALLAAWDAGPSPDLARALAASLGKLGSKRALERLEAAGDRDAPTATVVERARLTIARDVARESESRIDPDRALAAPVRVVIRCRAGLERIVAEEVLRVLGSVDKPVTYSARVKARFEGKLEELFRVRTADSFAFALPPVRLGDRPEDALVTALGSELARLILETWTRGTVRYRIAWASGHRRASTWRAAEALAKSRPGWLNDPTESTWEAFAREEGSELFVELVPRGLVDPRFAYRVRDVPAASHAPLAAALVRVAEVRPDDRVWDPFMGSGVELVERSLAGPYVSLSGTDTDPRALDAARANFAAAGLAGVHVAVADGTSGGFPAGVVNRTATTHAPGDVTLVLTNPPMGRRLLRDGSLAPLLDRFIDHVARVLVPGGRLVWLSPFGARTAARARERGLAVELEEEVDMGGFRARLQRITRRG
jgi:23S rRNA G2445 N2-methylase RlmL